VKTIEVIKYLITEIEQQQALLIEYEARVADCRKKEDELEKAGQKYPYVPIRWNGAIPKKAHIHSNLRKIRLLALDMLKEVK
jgi:hypothetical protein